MCSSLDDLSDQLGGLQGQVSYTASVEFWTRVLDQLTNVDGSSNSLNLRTRHVVTSGSPRDGKAQSETDDRAM